MTDRPNHPLSACEHAQAGEPVPPDGQLLIYQDGATRLQVRLDGQTVWLSQRLIAELFQVSVKTVSEHLVNIYSDGELDPGATIRKFRIVQTEGSRQVSRAIDHYNLDAILAVGYRVRSARGTAFRQWATARLSELLVKGFTMDDERLKEGRSIGADYFDELLERIRNIRASERMFYQKITDIYATSIDYDPAHPLSQTFFATVQNKLHFAIHGRTAAEVIQSRADAAQPGRPVRLSLGNHAVASAFARTPNQPELPRRMGPPSYIIANFHGYSHDEGTSVAMDTEERWVSVEDVAAHLAVNKDSIYRWIEKKGFPSHRVGRLLRFKLSEVDEWVRKGGGEGEATDEIEREKE